MSSNIKSQWHAIAPAGLACGPGGCEGPIKAGFPYVETIPKYNSSIVRYRCISCGEEFADIHAGPMPLDMKQAAAQGLGTRCVLCKEEYPSISWWPSEKPMFCGSGGCKGLVQPRWEKLGGVEFVVSTKPPDPTYKSQCPMCFQLYKYDPNAGFVCEGICRVEEGTGGKNLNARPELTDIMSIGETPTTLTLVSFSYKYGPPEGLTKANIYDIRQKIRNPWRVEALRPLNGTHPDVQAYVKQCKGTKVLVPNIMTKYKYWQYRGIIAVGCNGGKHRSVALVEMIAEELRKLGKDVVVEHRDLLKKAKVSTKEITDGEQEETEAGG